jgi:hypothetical protein
LDFNVCAGCLQDVQIEGQPSPLSAAASPTPLSPSADIEGSSALPPPPASGTPAVRRPTKAFDLEWYRELLTVCVAAKSISPEEMRLLKGVRKKYAISDAEHLQVRVCRGQGRYGRALLLLLAHVSGFFLWLPQLLKEVGKCFCFARTRVQSKRPRLASFFG